MSRLFLPLLLAIPIAQAAKVNGPVAPNGTEIQVDLPGPMHRANTESKGLGLCVFTSIHHSALWQEIPALKEFPQFLIDQKVEGGGYPAKVDKMVDLICKKRGLPKPAYLQVEGKDLEILKLACRTGRMPCVTYCWSPTGRYGGKKVAHMVSLVHADDSWFCVLDNNYCGADKYEWMSPTDFAKSYTGYGGGWCVIFLDPGPPPIPH